MRRTTQSVRPAVSITEPLIPTIRRVGAQLLAGQASYMQRVLPTDPSAQPEFLCTAVQPRQRTDLPLVVQSFKRWLASKARYLKSVASASVARRPMGGT